MSKCKMTSTLFPTLLLSVFVVLVVILGSRYVHLKEDLVPVKAFDNRVYLVQDIPDKQASADALARINQQMKALIEYLTDNVDNYNEYFDTIRAIKKRYNPESLSEGTVEEDLTSYTVNKGEKIVFCLRDRKGTQRLYNDNLLTYVAIHELAHVASVSEGHNEEFHRNFNFLLETARKLGLFEHQLQPTEYCGLHLAQI